MAGFFDTDYNGFSLLNPTLLGLMQGLGAASAPSRLPVTSGSVWGNIAGGLAHGQQQALQQQLANQNVNKDAIQTALLLNQLSQTAGALGQKTPSIEDIRSGKWQGFPWAQMFAGMGGGDTGGSANYPTPTKPIPSTSGMALAPPVSATDQVLAAQPTSFNGTPVVPAPAETMSALAQGGSPPVPANALASIGQPGPGAPGASGSPPPVQLAQNTATASDMSPQQAQGSLPEKMPPLPTLKQMAINRAFRSALGYQLTPIDQEIMAAASARPGSEEQKLHWLNAYKTAGLEPTLNLRQGGMGFQLNPATGKYDLVAQAPKLPEGGQLHVGPNGDLATSIIPGTIGGIASTSRAQASGPAGFKPEMFFGPTGQQYQGTALQLGMGAAPGLAAGSPQPLVPGQAPTTAAAPPAVPGAPANLRPEAAAPTFPVATPQGQKDISQVGIDDLFPGGQGIPMPPKPPAGLGYGPPSEGQKDVQKEDAQRVNGYNKEASENQKVYQDVAHLQDVLKRGLTTGKLTPLWTELTNIAHQVGADWAIPKNYNPTDAAVFTKASTDIVFALVKKLAGAVRVAEIQGYQQASPGLSIPLEANYSILNDVLSAGKWQDSRAKLANQFMVQHPGVPLNVFDDRFSQVAPLSSVTDRYRDQMIDLGGKLPGEEAGGNKAPIPQAPVTAIGPGGHRIELRNGVWVDSATGKAVQ